MEGPTGNLSRVGTILAGIVEVIETRPFQVWLLIWAATAVAVGFLLVTAGLDSLNPRGKGLLAFVVLGWIPPLVVIWWQKRRNRTNGTGKDEL